MLHLLHYVSVIIPTFRDEARLHLCLRALETQSYPRDRFEVVVVDNDPDSTGIVFENQWQLNIKVISEKTIGSYAARNAGLRCANGKIIAFTDSDCIPERKWIENGVSLLSVDGVDRVAGAIQLTFSSRRLTLTEIYEKAFAFRQHINAEAGWSVTANLFCFKESFSAIGFFDDRFMSGGDFEWGKRATEKGLSISFGPDVVVRHPARRTASEILKKVRRTQEANHKRRGTTKNQMIALIIPPGLIGGMERMNKVNNLECIIAYLYYYFLRCFRFFLILQISFRASFLR